MPLTPEERSERASLAGKKRAENAAKRRDAVAFNNVPLLTIEDYDGKLGQPVGWADGKRREEVRGEIILNDRRQVDLETARDAREVARGKLVDRSEVKKAAVAVRDAIAQELAQVSAAIQRGHPDVAADVMAQLMKSIDREMNSALDRAVERAQGG